MRKKNVPLPGDGGRSTLEQLIADLKAEADTLYCRYVQDATRRPLLLGAEAKLKAHTFTLDNLHAYQDHSAEYGRHVGLMKAVNALERLAAVRAPEPPQQEKGLSDAHRWEIARLLGRLEDSGNFPLIQALEAALDLRTQAAPSIASAEPPQLPQNDYAKRLLLDETPWPKAASDAINALQSIARNSCCSPCREAALVAQAALDQVSSPARSTTDASTDDH